MAILNTVEENKRLVERYPFLLPRNRWTDLTEEDYDYSWTELDAMPDGWRKAFGEMMCEEIRCALLAVSQEALDNYRIMQIKEKYSSLRWYDNGYPIGSGIDDIIGKYETLSKHICMRCGKPDVPITGDWWIFPFCKECYLIDERNTAEEWEEYAAREDNLMMPDIYKYTKFTKEGESEVVKINIKDTADAIRRRYADRIRKQ